MSERDCYAIFICNQPQLTASYLETKLFTYPMTLVNDLQLSMRSLVISAV